MRVSSVSFASYNSKNCTPIRKATPSFGDIGIGGLDFPAIPNSGIDTLQNTPWKFLDEVGYTKQDRNATQYFLEAFDLKRKQMERPDYSRKLAGLSNKFYSIESWKDVASNMPNSENRRDAYELINNRSDSVVREYARLKEQTRDYRKIDAYDYICRKTLKGEYFDPNVKVKGRSLVEEVILGADKKLALKIMKHKKFVAPEVISDFAKGIYEELAEKAKPSKLVVAISKIFRK